MGYKAHYTSWVKEYESRRDAELKEVARWHRLECEKEWEKKQKGSEEQRTQRERKQSGRKWMDGLF